MKKSYCPWCGEKTITTINRMSRIFYFNSNCPSCKKQYRSFAKQKNKTRGKVFTAFSITKCFAYFFGAMTIVAAILFHTKHLSPICFAASSALMIICGLLASFFGEYGMVNNTIIRYENHRTYVPFQMLFSVKVFPVADDEDHNKSLTENFDTYSIFEAQFETKISKYQAMPFPLVFDQIEFSPDKTFTARCGFVQDKHVPKQLIQKGLRFSLSDGDRTVARGEITELFEKPIMSP